jgi:hypothetical protein
MSVRSLLVPLACAAALAATAATAAADEPVGTTSHGTPLVADAGYTAWRGDDGHLVVRAGTRAPKTTNLKPPAGAIFDVGTRRGGGGGQLVWAEGCSARSRACAVRGAELTAAAVASGRLTTRVIAHVGYRGGGAPAVAVDGSRLAYAVRGTTGSGRRRVACDVPYVRTLGGRGGAARRLDRGRCATFAQLDLGDGHVALLAHPAITYGSGASEARVVGVGGGASRTLQRESQGEESNFIGSVALDGGALYTARGGIRQADVFTRWDLATRARSDARAFVSLQGSFARDRGRDAYLQSTNDDSITECGCLVVAADDPFAAAARRTLAPELALTVTPQPVFADSAPAAIATLTRRTVTRTAVVGTAPVAGVAVELLSVTPTDPRTAPGAPRPTGRVATTGADGAARIAIPGPVAPYRFLAAQTRPAAGGAAIPTLQTTYLRAFAHVTPTAARLPDGRLRVTGTISPALPGRKVRLDRKLDRVCNAYTNPPGSIVSPSQVGVPTGCVDRYTQDPVATAAVSADGASFAIEAGAPAGTYRVSLDFAGGALVLPGESGPVAAP